MDIKKATTIMDQVIEARSDGLESRAWEIIKSNLPTTDNFKEELYMSEMIDISKLKTWDKPHKVFIPSKYGAFVKRSDLEQLLETAQKRINI